MDSQAKMIGGAKSHLRHKASAIDSGGERTLTQHEFETANGMESLMFEPTVLLNAASIVNRIGRQDQEACNQRNGCQITMARLSSRFELVA